MAILLPALILLLPLLITPGVLFHYDIVPKVVLLALAVSFALVRGDVAGSLAALRARRSGQWLCILSGVQVLWLALGTAISVRPLFSLLGSNWRRMGLLTFAALLIFTVLAAGHFASGRGVSQALRAFALATMIASAYGILQYFDIDPLQAASLYHAQAGDSTIVRTPGTLGHADYFGWWLAVSMFCALGMAGVEKGTWRWVARSAAGLAGVAILVSGTRSAILAVIAGMFSLALLAGVRIRRTHAASAVACVALLAAFYFSDGGARMRTRVRWSADEPLGGARPLQWRDSLKMVAARPVQGFGLETFSSEFPQYQSLELARLFPDFYHESPHNSALDVLTESGVPGLILAFGWIALGADATRRAKPARPWLVSALASALVASGVAGMFGALTLGPAFATAVMVAMLVGLNPEDRKAGLIPHGQRSIAGLVAAPLALCLTVYGVWLGLSDFEAARFQNAASLATYRTAAAAAMPGAAEDLYFSRRLSQICAGTAGCGILSIQAAARATQTADNPPNAWYNLSMFAASQNDARGVESALRKASSLAPNWFKPHWTLGNFLKLTGRPGEAQRETARAVLLDGGRDPEVGR